ncbi:MAG: hypothetical protein RPU13_07615 [Candidatus Sedimenticola sp. (ex Thyasira tokunagai)]
MIRSVLMLAIAAILITAGSGCSSTPEVRYVAQPLPMPQRPLLPALSADDLACITNDAYYRLVQRNRLRREYAEELEAIIQANNQGTEE